MNFCSGRCYLELAQVPARVALALHLAGRSTPSGVTEFARVCACGGLAQFADVSPPGVSRCQATLRLPGTLSQYSGVTLVRMVSAAYAIGKHAPAFERRCCSALAGRFFKLTWLVLGGDPAARSHRVEQLTAL